MISQQGLTKNVGIVVDNILAKTPTTQRTRSAIIWQTQPIHPESVEPNHQSWQNMSHTKTLMKKMNKIIFKQ